MSNPPRNILYVDLRKIFAARKRGGGQSQLTPLPMMLHAWFSLYVFNGIKLKIKYSINEHQLLKDVLMGQK